MRLAVRRRRAFFHEMTRQQLCRLFEEAVARLDPARLVRDRLADGDFQAGRIVAIGKAAQRMVDGCLSSIPRLVISPYPARDEHELESTHPMLSDCSYRAGDRLTAFVAGGGPVLLLISGGASALVEVCPVGQNSREWMLEWRQLFGAGLDIVTMNQERARRSAIKGGKLLDWLGGPSLTLLLSDVLQGPQWVGSGLTWRQPQPLQHRVEVLADGSRLVREMQNQLKGYQCEVRPPFIETLEQAAESIRQWAPAPGEAVLASAEVTLAVRGDGLGGRCQHLAAVLVPWLRDKPYLFLAAASDGVDGTAASAGACVDGSFPEPARYLAKQDSYHYFRDFGECWNPGPTGNNLNDLLVLVNPRT